MTPESPAPGVFEFFDGEKKLFGDPLRIQRELYSRLSSPGKSPDEVFADYESDEFARWAPAAGLIADAARLAFPMAAFDPATGKGATEQHCRDAVDALWSCLAKKNGSIAGSVTSSAPTGATPDSSPPTSASA